jgi:hypothetical protein
MRRFIDDHIPPSVNRVAVRKVSRSEMRPIMMLISRQPRVEPGVQVITVNDFITRPNMKLVARQA